MSGVMGALMTILLPCDSFSTAVCHQQRPVINYVSDEYVYATVKRTFRVSIVTYSTYYNLLTKVSTTISFQFLFLLNLANTMINIYDILLLLLFWFISSWDSLFVRLRSFGFGWNTVSVQISFPRHVHFLRSIHQCHFAYSLFDLAML